MGNRKNGGASPLHTKQFTWQDPGRSAWGTAGYWGGPSFHPDLPPSSRGLANRWGAKATPNNSLSTLLGQFESGAFSKLLHAKVGPSSRAELTQALEEEGKTSRWSLGMEAELGSPRPSVGSLPDILPGPLEAMRIPTRLPPRDLAANPLLGWPCDTHLVETDILSTVQSWTPNPPGVHWDELCSFPCHTELFTGGAKMCAERRQVPQARQDPSGMEKARTKCPKEEDQPSQGARLQQAHIGQPEPKAPAPGATGG